MESLLSRYGKFSVNCDYYLIMKRLVDNESYCEDDNWMSIWSLKIPPRMELLIWRIEEDAFLQCCNTIFSFIGKF